MDAEFYQVAIPEPTTIMGLRLRPLSLGHLILLGRVRSAFVTEGEPITLHDLALSVLICSLSYKDGCDLFNNTELPRFFKRWHDKLAGINFWTKCGFKKPTPVDYAAKVAAFSKYMETGSSSPYYSYKADEALPIQCPTVQIVKVALMRELHIPEAELMDRPWSVCLWDYVTIRALDGNLQFEDRDQIKQAQKLADEIAEKVRNGTWPT